MKSKNILYIILVVVVVAIIIFLLSNNKNKTQNIDQSVQSESNQQPVANNEADNTEVEMVDCGKSKDPSCFLNRMNNCLPATTEMTAVDDRTKINITILGIENDKCHFQRKIDDTLSLDCYFPKGTLNMDTLDQMFGNDKGMQQIVDEACTIPGW